MARADDKARSSAAREGSASAKEAHLAVSELVSDRAAAPSPFGDDQTFPLPVERLNYIPTVSL
ncbi:hypothetical protein [Actinoplanes sp. NPDC026623]|uniref:hypothetical protein n=1 Tax=Actinoplanes sp. NPDC026623 TaxID=3155610 RepID=UPI0033EA3DAC